MPEMTRAELAQMVGRERLRADAAEERAERLEAELQEARAGWKGGRALSPTQMRRIHKLVLHQEGLDRDALWTALSDLRSLRAELDARCDKDGCEQYREWLSGEKAEADKRARQAEAERDRLAEQVKHTRDLLPEIDGTFRRLCGRLSTEDQEALAEVYMALLHNLGALDGTEGDQ